MGIYSHIFGTERPPGQYAKNYLYCCERAGYITDNPEFTIDRDFIDDYLIVYVISGIFHLESGGKKFALAPGYTAIVSLKEKHLYFSDKNDACEVLWMDFNCTDDKMSLLSNLTHLPVVYECRENLGLMNEFVYQYVHNILFGEINQSEIIYRLILSAVSSLRNDTEKQASVISEVENFINNNIGRKISLPELADVMHLSKYHFLHIFKQRYGKSPIQHVISKKINRASYLLIYSNLTVTEISEQLGFCNQSHFSMLFKKNMGTFPAEYRKNHHK